MCEVQIPRVMGSCQCTYIQYIVSNTRHQGFVVVVLRIQLKDTVTCTASELRWWSLVKWKWNRLRAGQLTNQIPIPGFSWCSIKQLTSRLSLMIDSDIELSL